MENESKKLGFSVREKFVKCKNHAGRRDKEKGRGCRKINIWEEGKINCCVDHLEKNESG